MEDRLLGTRLCAICGNRLARYVCQKCGRTVCEECLETPSWLCRECHQGAGREGEGPEETDGLHSAFLKAFLLGFLLIFVGTVILMVTALIQGLPDSAGLIVFIGPIPIILGAGKYSFLAILLAVVLTVLGIAFFMISKPARAREPPVEEHQQ